YPNKLSGESIPVEGRITAISDVFDALTTIRPYKDAWPIDKAVELIKSEAGKQFDPNLVELFLREIDKVVAVREEYAD
ncbi:MAG: metal-dependent phosphohydrolase, partial [Gammaproteobacteria bacterium]|nr:metal-dependent phosphohydrolase [Gammaproteobacteria bacterium]